MILGGLLACVGCGGGGGGAAGPDGTIFAGAFTVTADAPGVTTCQATHPITWTAAGASTHAITLAGGDCLEFTNADTAPHRPASAGATLCAQLNAPGALAAGQTFTTTPFILAESCQWIDALNPPAVGGGGGGY